MRWNGGPLGLMSPLTSHDEKVVLAREYVQYERYLEQLIADRRTTPQAIRTGTR